MIRIHIVGDSHVSIFSGKNNIIEEYPATCNTLFDFLYCYRLGPVLAYSLAKEDTTNRGREKILELLDKISKNDYLLLMFGEIDCRFHIKNQSELKNKNTESIINETVESYTEFVDLLINLGYNLGIISAVPTGIGGNPNFPHKGTFEERNEITKLFNFKLLKFCKRKNIPLIIINGYFKNSIKNHFYYTYDGVHYNQIALRFYLFEFLRKIPEIKLTIKFISLILKSYNLFIFKIFNTFYFNYVSIIKKEIEFVKKRILWPVKRIIKKSIYK